MTYDSEKEIWFQSNQFIMLFELKVRRNIVGILFIRKCVFLIENFLYCYRLTYEIMFAIVNLEGVDIMSREEAFKILNKYVKTEFYIKHSLAVEAIMRELAQRLDKDNVELWGIAGLLHDLDEESCPWKEDMKTHGPKSKEILIEEGFGNEVLYNAIMAHNPICGYKAKTNLEYALLAADPMSGFIAAIAKGYPDKKVKSVKVSSVLKRFKEARYARGANRSYMMAIEKTGISLEEFAELSLQAMCKIDKEIDL